jgi:hypothetical protein
LFCREATGDVGYCLASKRKKKERKKRKEKKKKIIREERKKKDSGYPTRLSIFIEHLQEQLEKQEYSSTEHEEEHTQ